MTTRTPPPTATTAALGSRHRAAFPLQVGRYVVMVTTYNNNPSYIYEEPGLHIMT
jgi:hypothetical protein